MSIHNPITNTHAGALERLGSMIKGIARRVTGTIDLREFQSALYKHQRAERVIGASREALKSRRRLFRLRVRRPRVQDLKVVDTQRMGGRLYFELSNGQVVRADRPHSNPYICRLIFDEVERNASRAVA